MTRRRPVQSGLPDVRHVRRRRRDALADWLRAARGGARRCVFPLVIAALVALVGYALVNTSRGMWP